MWISRICSLAVALAFLALGSAVDPQPASFLMDVFALVVPLALIWFPEALSDYLGRARGGCIEIPAPAMLVAIAGWVLLLSLPLIAWLIAD